MYLCALYIRANGSKIKSKKKEVIRVKKISIIFLVMLFLVLATACNLITGPEKSFDTVEFMFQRVAPIIDPRGQDPDYLMIRYSQIGGKNIKLTSTEYNQWRGETMLDYNINSENPYYIWAGDSKTMECARNIFVRIKGQQNWILLTCIKPNGVVPGIEWAVFCLGKDGIYFPQE